MAGLTEGWRIQVRVIIALMIRELTTRFGRENIGFLWVMVEPLLFAGLVAIVWAAMRGSETHGISIISFVITGYIPLTLFRSAVSRSVKVFEVNGSLLYHRQIKLIDFIFVRFLIEMIGSLFALMFIGTALYVVGIFPLPYSFGHMLLGWLLYSLFTFSMCLVIAPLSEMSDILEKFIPVVTYLMIPLSGTFFLVQWLTPSMREFILWSPPVTAMELLRFGLYGHSMRPYYDISLVVIFSLIMTVIGLALCRKVRRTLVVG